jgi:hypothetical protein
LSRTGSWFPAPLEVTVAEELIAFASKQEMLAKSKQFWNPDKTQFWIDSGASLVIDRRDGYFIYDVEGKRLIGAAGRIYLSEPAADVRRAQAEITEVLSSVTGREQ